jgi:hypothetical protein
VVGAVDPRHSLLAEDVEMADQRIQADEVSDAPHAEPKEGVVMPSYRMV